MTIEVYCAFEIDTSDILHKYEYIMEKNSVEQWIYQKPGKHHKKIIQLAKES
jgi:hypothetical protein